MAGPQFVHIETYSRKPDKRGNSVDQVLGEVERDPGFSVHVADPCPPVHVAGIPLSEVRARHDAMVDAAATPVLVKGVTHHRAIRKDRPTLMTMVASFPISRADLESDPEGMARLAEWRDATVEWAREQFGRGFLTAVEHVDEEYPHLHIYAIPVSDPGAQANSLHPGHVAKLAAEADAIECGLSKSEALKAGNEAYKAAMRDFQTRYYREVGEPCGLLRDGPKRKRQSRADYLRDRDAAERRRSSVLEARRVELDAEAARQQAAADALDQRKADMEDAEAGAKVRQEEADRIRQEAADEARQQSEAFIALAGEIEAGTIGVKPGGRITASNLSVLKSGGAALLPAAGAMGKAVTDMKVRDGELTSREGELKQREDDIAARERDLVHQMGTVEKLRDQLRNALSRVARFLRRDDLTDDARRDAVDLVRDVGPLADPFSAAAKESVEPRGPGL